MSEDPYVSAGDFVALARYKPMSPRRRRALFFSWIVYTIGAATLLGLGGIAGWASAALVVAWVGCTVVAGHSVLIQRSGELPPGIALKVLPGRDFKQLPGE